MPSGTGLKSRECAAATSLSRSKPPALSRRFTRVLGGPGLHLQARLAAGGQLELLPAPGALHHLPGVAGRGRGVDDDRAGRSLARGALVFIVPAAVVEAPLAGEQVRVPVRVVVHHDQDLALEVHALEVVPLEFRGLHAVADEYQLGVLRPRRSAPAPRSRRCSRRARRARRAPPLPWKLQLLGNCALRATMSKGCCQAPLAKAGW